MKKKLIKNLNRMKANGGKIKGKLKVSKQHQRQGAAWGVHLYTAIGGIIGTFALLFAYRDELNYAFLLLMVSMLIDATDGMMARKLKVKEVLPKFDGATVDNVIDMFTFAWIPVFIMGAQHLLPHDIFLLIPIFAALYAYGQVDMKTDDNFFLGFPTYWNIVALYLYLFRPDDVIAVLIVLIPGILSFIPTRYLYPSKNVYMWQLTWALGAVWGGMMLYILLADDVSKNFMYASLFYPAYYMIVSFYVEAKIRLIGKL